MFQIRLANLASKYRSQIVSSRKYNDVITVNFCQRPGKIVSKYESDSIIEKIQKTEFKQLELAKEMNLFEDSWTKGYETQVDVQQVEEWQRILLMPYFDFLSGFNGKSYFLNVMFHTKHSCSKWSLEMKKEREFLATYFTKKVLELSHFMGKINVLIDYIDPFTLKSNRMPLTHVKVLRETDLVVLKKGISVQHEKCCPYIVHSSWDSNVYLCCLMCHISKENKLVLKTICNYF